MASADIQFSSLKVIGEATCVGGKHPDPPLDEFPLLAWSGGKVHTEDGQATVEDIAMTLSTMPNVDAIAEKYGTTAEHVVQAVNYAVKAGFLGS